MKNKRLDPAITKFLKWVEENPLTAEQIGADGIAEYLTLQLRQCAHCGDWFSRAGVRKHVRYCVGCGQR